MRQRLLDGLVAVSALATSVWLALRTTGLGDYPNDGGPAVDALLHGRAHAFFHANPAMGTLSVYVRVPFAALAYLGHPTAQNLYRWGSVPCVAAVAIAGLWLARVARSRGVGVTGQLAIVAVSLGNPMVGSALALGHPEELLTAALAVCALMAAVEGRTAPAAILLGLALASKQWAVLSILPVLLALGGGRLRALAMACATAAVLTLPLAIGSPSAFLANQVFLVHQQVYLHPAAHSWLYPLAPEVRIVGLHGSVSWPTLSPTVVGLVHPLIIVVAAGLAAAVWVRRRGRPSLDELFTLTALVYLLRCTLDTETMPYFHLPLLLTLLAWDGLHGDRLPLRAIAGAGVGYFLFQRLLGGTLDVHTVSYLYGACTLVLALVLGLRLARSRSQLPRLAGGPGLLGPHRGSTAGSGVVG
jgi:hypothetical protein